MAEPGPIDGVEVQRCAGPLPVSSKLDPGSLWGCRKRTRFRNELLAQRMGRRRGCLPSMMQHRVLRAQPCVSLVKAWACGRRATTQATVRTTRLSTRTPNTMGTPSDRSRLTAGNGSADGFGQTVSGSKRGFVCAGGPHQPAALVSAGVARSSTCAEYGSGLERSVRGRCGRGLVVPATGMAGWENRRPIGLHAHDVLPLGGAVTRAQLGGSRGATW